VVDLRQNSLLSILVLILITAAGCSGLSTLTADSLRAAQERWNSSGPSYYSMTIEMKGDRLELSKYDVTVRDKSVVKLERNGQVVLPAGGSQDYSVDGLFHILDEEIDLAKNPVTLGAPPGYASYPLASFDPATGRLLRFQRSVGGTKNSIEIDVTEFKVLGR
jgi:hypothetical protein